jgi:hypothetical protein
MAEVAMQIKNVINSFFKGIFKNSTFAWWVKIDTANPPCVYYFGPFDSSKEARLTQDGYIEDLEEEKSQIVSVEIKYCKPKELTICQEEV